MPQNDPVSKALADAKGALAHANSTFPSSKPAAKPAPAAAPAKPAPTLGDELAATKQQIDKNKPALPKMHSGGPVMADGAYQLKAGEHVLTASEAQKARKHALMASGMKSLASPGKKSKK